jgi:hypothetical protein
VFASLFAFFEKKAKYGQYDRDRIFHELVSFVILDQGFSIGYKALDKAIYLDGYDQNDRGGKYQY